MNITFEHVSLSLFACMYITLMPAVIAGVLTSIWCKLPILKFMKKPLDGGKCLRDKRRIFGDNKTVKGFVGYMFLNMICMPLWGLFCSLTGAGAFNFFYVRNDNALIFNLLVGLLVGFAYALFELPNSFLKRRLDITPGKTIKGPLRVFFIFLDQADSLFGCCLVVYFFCPMPIWCYFLYVFVGAATHLIINMLLYFAHLRKNMF